MSKVERGLLDHYLLAVDDVEACSCGLFVETTAIEGEVGVGYAFGAVDLLDAGLFVIVAEVEDEGLDWGATSSCMCILEVSTEGADGDVGVFGGIIQGVIGTEIEYGLITWCESIRIVVSLEDVVEIVTKLIVGLCGCDGHIGEDWVIDIPSLIGGKIHAEFTD